MTEKSSTVTSGFAGRPRCDAKSFSPRIISATIGRIVVAVLLVSGLMVADAFGQRGDRKGHKMKEVWKDMEVPSAEVYPPQKALDTLKMAPGFRVELVAAEPLVEDPVAMAWDGEGRLWVVEMRGFMPDVDGTGEDVRNGQVVVLEDTNADGKMDKSTVFLDKLQMPRAIAMVEGGVLVSEPPYLWYCEDTDGDLVSDRKTEVFKGYGKQGPVEHTENALTPAIDNWMYNAKSSRRVQFKEGKIISDKTRSRGQWGLAMDDYGRLYYTTNSNYLFSDWDIYHNLGTKFTKRPVKDSSVYPIRVNPGINRGYKGKMLRDDGRLNRITAISGPAIYRGGQYPDDYIGSAFIPEPAANVLTLHTLQESDGGKRLKSNHELYKDDKWGKREFLASPDERFRPVSTYHGPDGCIYVVDMYRGILQHKVYVTSFLRKQILERGLDKPLGLGRIYRIVYDENPVDYSSPKLQDAAVDRLIKTLSHRNGWWRSTAQRLLVERNDKSAIPALKKTATVAESHLARIHALWTLHGMNALDHETSVAALEDEHPKVRLTALTTAAQSYIGEPAVTIAAIEALKHDSDAAVKSLANHMSKKLTGKQVVKTAKDYGKDLKGSHKAAFYEGKKLYEASCIACHQADGQGLGGTAPPLAGSSWVKADPALSIRVTLDGLSGPITVSGKNYKNLPVMPGHKTLMNDKEIANVLTYVRREWGNGGKEPVTAEQVTALRTESEDREVPWTQEELEEIK